MCLLLLYLLICLELHILFCFRCCFTTPRSSCSSAVFTFFCLQIISLKITNHSLDMHHLIFNQLMYSFHQPCQFCLNSPPHSLVEPSSSSSPLSASITLLLPAQNLPFQQILLTKSRHHGLLLQIVGLDWTGLNHAHWLIFCSFFVYIFLFDSIL